MEIIFNNNINQSLEEIKKICAEHYACKDCIVIKQNGLHNDNTVTICDKIEEKFYNNINNKK